MESSGAFETLREELESPKSINFIRGISLTWRTCKLRWNDGGVLYNSAVYPIQQLTKVNIAVTIF